MRIFLNTLLIKHLFVLIIFSFLFGCTSKNSQPVFVLTNTLEPIDKVVPTQTKTQPVQIPTKTPTLTPLPPYPEKQVHFNYTISGFHSPYDFWFNFSSSRSKLVLYNDGEMIIPGQPYQHKVLSDEEINDFFIQLNDLGFYTIETNQQHNPTDKLYDFGDLYSEAFDGLWTCISVNSDKSRNLCAYEPFREFLIPEMESLFQFIDNYKPEDALPYYPDRILLWIQRGRNPYDTNLPEGVIPWTESLLSLVTNTEKIIYTDGENAKELYVLYGDKGYVFTENGKEYTVYIKIVLPHEKITNQYE